MREISFREQSYKEVLAVIAREWAWLATRCAGADAVGSTFPRSSFATASARQRAIAKANATRQALARAIFEMTGREVPDLDLDGFMPPYRPPHPSKYAGAPRYASKYAEQERGRLVREICEPR